MQKLTANELISHLNKMGLTPYEFYDSDETFCCPEEYDDFDEYEELVGLRDNYDEIATDRRIVNQSEKLQAIKKDLLRLENIRDAKFNSELKIGKWEIVDEYGGEGKGEEHYYVLYFKDHDVYLKCDGFYTSYEGADYDDSEWQHVVPKQITQTIYVRP